MVHVAQSLESALECHYGIHAEHATLFRRGHDISTRKWFVTSNIGPLFLKEYLPGFNLELVTSAATFTNYAGGQRIPVAAVLPTISGQLVCTWNDRAIVVSSFLVNTEINIVLNAMQSVQAAISLGALHLRCNSFPPVSLPRDPLWLKFNYKNKVAEIRRYITHIRHLALPTSFDEEAHEMLCAQTLSIEKVPQLLEGLESLPRHIVHGDYTAQNLLFQGNVLVAVIDFRAAQPFYRGYELARIMLPPERVAVDSNWWNIAKLTATAYCTRLKIDRVEFQTAARVWVIQLLRSTYGIKQHYIAPVSSQSSFDEYWLLRQRSAAILLPLLTEIEDQLGKIWDSVRL